MLSVIVGAVFLFSILLIHEKNQMKINKSLRYPRVVKVVVEDHNPSHWVTAVVQRYAETTEHPPTSLENQYEVYSNRGLNGAWERQQVDQSTLIRLLSSPSTLSVNLVGEQVSFGDGPAFRWAFVRLHPLVTHRESFRALFGFPYGILETTLSNVFLNKERCCLHYIALGTEGIGVFDYTQGIIYGDYYGTPMISIVPIPEAGVTSGLKLTSGLQIVIVISIFLLFPPFPLIQHWFLKQSYRYAFQPGEIEALNRYTAIITLFSIFVAGVAKIIWLISHLDYVYLSIGAVGVIGLIGSLGGLWISRNRHFSSEFTIRMVMGSGTVSVLAPLGTVLVLLGTTSTEWVWWAIIGMGLGFASYRGLIDAYLEETQTVMAQWRIDRMACQMCLIFLVLLIPVTTFPVALFIRHFSMWMFPLVLLIPFITIFGVYLYVAYIGSEGLSKKQGRPHLAFSGIGWWRSLFRATSRWLLLWIVATILMAVVQRTIPTLFRMIVG
jgi:hypothetical protein